MVLVRRELENEKCTNTFLLSNINEKFFKPSVVVHVEAIKICQQQNSTNPFAIIEDKIIENFNLTLNNLPCILCHSRVGGNDNKVFLKIV
ncbi:MAG: hypothetical protein O7C59_11140 [Rickettsia endosymbiont of Ixodes persulcatus]|nr:hypothetical protein [Rickettsia endosymbiont of Ixodes persulcatus]MCZ6903638.1 hypothetical protein [Rickettsia endosymbiont of Ixodes persulcatus]MCZ6908596.1 hypothetical protein [Rickettsia endosymbiont of Ixodes persulcatus]MCZ6910324.1 hypothetical protein [Rickettsia endosymbiont of Ixodes persulcatus]MCZ6914922.1 hypothetical protein [Rickettsia endosymbiont of Ixodes persulcatus]